MKVAFVDCFSGISGDMFLGALVDAGLPIERLKVELKKLDLPDPYHLSAEKVKKGAVTATLVSVDVAGVAEIQVHREPDLHAHTHEHEHAHTHDHIHPHAAAEQSSTPHSETSANSHAHGHRSMRDIAALIEASRLSERVRAQSLAIFQRLAEAEGRIHGEPPDEVRFHEVGAVDSILDIVGAAIGLELLGIDRLYASALPMGSGKVKTQHGLLPLPAPATLDLMRQVNMPVVPSAAEKELVTPTGAAILAALATFEQPAMRITGVGTGAGKRELAWPNILRLIIGESGGQPGQGELVLIETNIDDMSAQGFGQVMARLFAGGALDVYFTPIFMKKNRPATMLSVIASRQNEPALAKILLSETTTFGMRVQPIGRYEAQREIRKVATSFGAIDVKLKFVEGKVIQAVPEYDVCLRIAEEKNIPFLVVYQEALSAGRVLLTD